MPNVDAVTGSAARADQAAEMTAAEAHALWIEPAQAIYSYVPKNACTTLRYATVLANRGAEPPAGFESMGQDVLTMLATPEQIAAARYRFIVLRCPWARLASVFFDKVVGGKRRGRTLRLNAVEHRQGKTAVLVYKALEALGLKKYLDPEIFTFRTFVDLISAPGGLAIDHHWTPQSEFDLGLQGHAYTDVFGMHDLEAAFAKITEATGMAIYDTRDLSGHGTQRMTKVNDRCYADVPLAELARMKAAAQTPTPAAFYDAPLQEQVQKLYAADFEFYANHLGASGLTFPIKPS